MLLLLRFNEPRRKESDNECESGLSFVKVDDLDELGNDSVTFFSSNEMTNLSRSAKSIVFGEYCTLLLLLILNGDGDDAKYIRELFTAYRRNSCQDVVFH